MKIHVTFVDAATGQTFAQADLPHEQLPASFEADTTLHLGDADWRVERAEPVTAAEFQRGGALRLVLRKLDIQMMAPEKILFSLSTINDFIPAIAEGTSKLGKRVLELHEDDWRQVELVATAHQPDLDRALAAIRDVHANGRKGAGFVRLHVRVEVPRPLRGVQLALAELQALPGATPLDGISYRGVAGLVAAGFALTLTSGCRLYGVTAGDRVTTLGLAGDAPVPTELAALEALARTHQLCLLDWCRAQQAAPGDFAACL